ncbi:hypothetical protein Y1Q_0007348 [Alligator mississippiensis]|uniref:Uncharacterized protein n=1 Tax=Alligator mississippiensis TaxID=8496 RepID=A0A151P814_ALLMI|nr:hypothetical protein Y1Q_0007348 [Alligator mississippiensis]
MLENLEAVQGEGSEQSCPFTSPGLVRTLQVGKLGPYHGDPAWLRTRFMKYLHVTRVPRPCSEDESRVWSEVVSKL